MTTSNPRKMMKQLKNKPAKLKKFMKHNLPIDRKIGIGSKKCRRCGRTRAHIDKYGLDLCRQCFREIAKDLGFKKYN